MTDARREALTTADFRTRARRRLPRQVFDYLEGGSDDEVTLLDNSDAYRRYRFTPVSLVDVAAVDLATEIAGFRASAPFGLAPAGYNRMMHPSGEPAVAIAAAAARVPYCLSTVATTTLEDVAAAAGVPPWLQLYLLRDRAITRDLIARAAAAGVTALVVTIDTGVGGNRLRDRRNGVTIPPRLLGAGLTQLATRPRYWIEARRAPAYAVANVMASVPEGSGVRAGSPAEIGAQFDPTVDWTDIEWVRSVWSGPVFVKGTVSATDAARAASLGIDGIWLSNHGGRQLDRAIAPIELVAEVRRAVPSATLVVDSGVRSGVDVAVALALGADAAFIGRPYLWGLAAAGGHGVARVIEIVTAELRRTMGLLGVTSVTELRARGAELLRRA